MKKSNKLRDHKSCALKLLYLSTLHAEPSDCDGSIIDCGLIVDVIGDTGMQIDCSDDLDEVDGISPTLRESLSLAKRLGYAYCRFSRVGDQIKGFPVGNWKLTT